MNNPIQYVTVSARTATGTKDIQVDAESIYHIIEEAKVAVGVWESGECLDSSLSNLATLLSDAEII